MVGILISPPYITNIHEFIAISNILGYYLLELKIKLQHQ